MCLTFFVFGCAPPQPLLLLAFNRDEYFPRPTQPLHEWEDGSGITGGKDLDGGGTWLGLNARTGRIAFLTNLRSRDSIEPSTHEERKHSSRGELPTGFLTGSSSPQDYEQSISPDQYYGYNLVVGDLRGDPRVGSLAYTNNGIDGVLEVDVGSSASNGNCNGISNTLNNSDNDKKSKANDNGNNGSTNGTEAKKDESAKTGVGGDGDCKGGAHQSEGQARSDGNQEEQHPGQQQQPAGCCDAAPRVRLLQPGRVYGLSNGVLMELPKVASGVEVLQRLLPDVRQDRPIPWDRLYGDLLGDSRRLVPPSGRYTLATATAAAAATAARSSSAGSPASPVSASSVATTTATTTTTTTTTAAAPSAAAEGGGSDSSGGGGGGIRTTTQCVCVSDGDGGGGDSNGADSSGGAGGADVGNGGDGGNGGDSGISADGDGGNGSTQCVCVSEAEYFVPEQAHLTSGRFVSAMQSPFGLYGTRSQTVILVWRDGRCEVRERHLHQDGVWREETMELRMPLT